MAGFPLRRTDVNFQDEKVGGEQLRFNGGDVKGYYDRDFVSPQRISIDNH